MSQLTEIRGTVTSIRYRKGTFTIAVVDTKEETISVLGDMLDCMAGREYVFRGEYSYNAKFGKQFRFAEYEEPAPADTDGIIAFLSSGMIKGIGPKTKDLLLSKLKSVKRIKEADLETLTEIIGLAKAKIVFDFFQTKLDLV